MKPAYHLTSSRNWQGGILLKFLKLAYGELAPGHDLKHLERMMEQFYQPTSTPLWLVEHPSGPAGCLWLGQATDQISGQRCGYIFLVYVYPVHRQQGLATALINAACDWSRGQGFTQIQLQVMVQSAAAQALYHKLSFNTCAYVLTRSLG